MKYEAFARSAGEMAIAPVYVLYGGEDLMVTSALKLIKRKVLGDDLHQADYTEMEGDGADPAALFDLLRTQDLFGAGGRHLVVMYNAGKFANTHKKKLETFHKSGGAAGTLVLLVPGSDRGWKVPKYLEKAGTVIDCQSPRAGDLVRMVRSMAQKQGKALGAGQAKLLIEMGGHDLGQLYQQVLSLAGLVGDRTRIEEADILSLLGSDVQRDVWDLLNAVTGKRPGEALRVLDRLFRQDRAEAVAPMVIGTLNYEFRQLAQAKERLDAGEPPPAVKKAMSGPMAVREQRLREASRLTWDTVAAQLSAMSATDIACKTSSLPPQSALELLVLKLCG